jgi:leader peptidase (prepilin peptidase) / N-methyltransferase
MLPTLFNAFLVLWLAFLGGTVGSFLNVVVYRLPAGLSLVHPPSRCPLCLHAIRWYDNIPVLGWLWLGGKCRDCRQPISARYPLVEAITAVLFVLVAWSEGLFYVWAEALVAVRGRWEPELLLSETADYLIRMVLICTLWTASLMQLDGQRAPGRMLVAVATGLGLGVMALTLFAEMQPGLRNLALPLLGGLATAGFAMLSTYFWTWQEAERLEGRWTFVELAGLCGIVVGVSSMIFVIACAVAIGLAAALVRGRRTLPLLCLLAGLVIHWIVSDYYLLLLVRMTPYYRYWMHGVWFSLLLVLMTEACVVIRRRTHGVAT